jgi:Ca2+-binding RTX toxin-like protein
MDLLRSILGDRPGDGRWTEMRKRLLAIAGIVGLSLASLGLWSTAAAAGSDCSIKGTSASGMLTGTEDADVICARGGSDFVDALAGDDIVRGGGGNDTVVGGEGDDSLFGGKGNDRLASEDGVSGNDSVSGGPGLDVCFIDEGDTTSGCERVLVVPSGS